MINLLKGMDVCRRMSLVLAIVTLVIFIALGCFASRRTPYERERNNLINAYNEGRITREVLDYGLRVLTKKYKGMDL